MLPLSSSWFGLFLGRSRRCGVLNPLERQLTHVSVVLEHDGPILHFLHGLGAYLLSGPQQPAIDNGPSTLASRNDSCHCITRQARRLDLRLRRWSLDRHGLVRLIQLIEFFGSQKGISPPAVCWNI